MGLNRYISTINRRTLKSSSINMWSLRTTRCCPSTSLTMWLILTRSNNLRHLFVIIALRFLLNQLKFTVLPKMLIFALNVNRIIMLPSFPQSIIGLILVKNRKSSDIAISINQSSLSFIAAFVVRPFA